MQKEDSQKQYPGHLEADKELQHAVARHAEEKLLLGLAGPGSLRTASPEHFSKFKKAAKKVLVTNEVLQIIRTTQQDLRQAQLDYKAGVLLPNQQPSTVPQQQQPAAADAGSRSRSSSRRATLTDEAGSAPNVKPVGDNDTAAEYSLRTASRRKTFELQRAPVSSDSPVPPAAKITGAPADWSQFRDFGRLREASGVSWADSEASQEPDDPNWRQVLAAKKTRQQIAPLLEDSSRERAASFIQASWRLYQHRKQLRQQEHDAMYQWAIEQQNSALAAAGKMPHAPKKPAQSKGGRRVRISLPADEQDGAEAGKASSQQTEEDSEAAARIRKRQEAALEAATHRPQVIIQPFSRMVGRKGRAARLKKLQDAAEAALAISRMAQLAQGDSADPSSEGAPAVADAAAAEAGVAGASAEAAEATDGNSSTYAMLGNGEGVGGQSVVSQDQGVSAGERPSSLKAITQGTVPAALAAPEASTSTPESRTSLDSPRASSALAGLGSKLMNSLAQLVKPSRLSVTASDPDPDGDSNALRSPASPGIVSPGGLEAPVRRGKRSFELSRLFGSNRSAVADSSSIGSTSPAGGASMVKHVGRRRGLDFGLSDDSGSLSLHQHQEQQQYTGAEVGPASSKGPADVTCTQLYSSRQGNNRSRHTTDAALQLTDAGAAASASASASAQPSRFVTASSFDSTEAASPLLSGYSTARTSVSDPESALLTPRSAAKAEAAVAAYLEAAQGVRVGEHVVSLSGGVAEPNAAVAVTSATTSRVNAVAPVSTSHAAGKGDMCATFSLSGGMADSAAAQTAAAKQGGTSSHSITLDNAADSSSNSSGESSRQPAETVSSQAQSYGSVWARIEQQTAAQPTTADSSSAAGDQPHETGGLSPASSAAEAEGGLSSRQGSGGSPEPLQHPHKQLSEAERQQRRRQGPSRAVQTQQHANNSSTSSSYSAPAAAAAAATPGVVGHADFMFQPAKALVTAGSIAAADTLPHTAPLHRPHLPPKAPQSSTAAKTPKPPNSKPSQHPSSIRKQHALRAVQYTAADVDAALAAGPPPAPAASTTAAAAADAASAAQGASSATQSSLSQKLAVARRMAASHSADGEGGEAGTQDRSLTKRTSLQLDGSRKQRSTDISKKAQAGSALQQQQSAQQSGPPQPDAGPQSTLSPSSYKEAWGASLAADFLQDGKGDKPPASKPQSARPEGPSNITTAAKTASHPSPMPSNSSSNSKKSGDRSRPDIFNRLSQMSGMPAGFVQLQQQAAAMVAAAHNKGSAQPGPGSRRRQPGQQLSAGRRVSLSQADAGEPNVSVARRNSFSNDGSGPYGTKRSSGDAGSSSSWFANDA